MWHFAFFNVNWITNKLINFFLKHKISTDSWKPHIIFIRHNWPNALIIAKKNWNKTQKKETKMPINNFWLFTKKKRKKKTTKTHNHENKTKIIKFAKINSTKSCRCTRAGLKQITCPSGLAFDIDKQTCDWKVKVTNCDQKESKCQLNKTEKEKKNKPNKNKHLNKKKSKEPKKQKVNKPKHQTNPKLWWIFGFGHFGTNFCLNSYF